MSGPIKNPQVLQILEGTKGRISEFASSCQDPDIPEDIRQEVLLALAEIAQHALNVRARYVSEDAVVNATPSVDHHA